MHIYLYIWKNCPKEQAAEFFWHVSQCLRFRMAMNSVEKASQAHKSIAICPPGTDFRGSWNCTHWTARKCSAGAQHGCWRHKVVFRAQASPLTSVQAHTTLKTQDRQGCEVTDTKIKYFRYNTMTVWKYYKELGSVPKTGEMGYSKQSP